MVWVCGWPLLPALSRLNVWVNGATTTAAAGVPEWANRIGLLAKVATDPARPVNWTTSAVAPEPIWTMEDAVYPVGLVRVPVVAPAASGAVNVVALAGELPTAE